MTVTSHPQIRETLSRFTPFDQLDEVASAKLAQSVRAMRVARGELVVQRGKAPGGMYLVVEGEVKLFLISSAGAEKIVRLARAGDTFCEETLFGIEEPVLAAQATRESVLHFIPRAAINAAMPTQPAFAMALMARLSRRVSELVEGMEQCMQRSSTQRVAHYLVQHADGDSIEVRLPCDKQTIASQLNLTPETFSRVLNRLTRDGAILPRGRRAIMLTDRPQLERIAA
ncbi:Crp/Fnr family transcriptional regulator [Azoarcus sp. KH32C]|uniref:Crp/Fnr family transcriptional regulator n=1 Tax=Azoarcus sp. KH32C TaxID=748247 RepID=UPI00023868DC|nr:Crp/Fnr family transcriptional regulator [Azoarcus sp. KH32C]BAL22646.1 transcriptional regulator Dnr-type [Azoarcus sp. KH32C]